MAFVKQFFKRPWLRVYSGISMNVAAAWFIVPFIGVNISFPDTSLQILQLLLSLVLGIIFALLAYWCEKELER